MKLQNGFEIEGNISTSMVKLNDIWTQVLIVESALGVEQLRELFKDNNVIVEATETLETTYNTNGLIDVKTQDNKNYVWLYFVNSSSRELIKTVVEDVEKLKKDKADLQDQVVQTQVAMAELMETVATLQTGATNA